MGTVLIFSRDLPMQLLRNTGMMNGDIFRSLMISDPIGTLTVVVRRRPWKDFLHRL